MPANTGIDLAPEVITKLAEHPKIIGIKDSGGDVCMPWLQNVCTVVNIVFQVISVIVIKK